MILNRTIAPAFNGVENIKLIQPEHRAFANGANLYTFNSGGQDLVRIEWIFNNLRFDPAKPLLNVAVNTMLTEGTATMTAAEIADKVDFYGAFLQVDYSYDTSQVTVYSLTKYLPQILPIVKDILTASTFPEKELATYVRNQQQKLAVSLQKNDFVARRIFNRAVSGDTIYGLTAEPAHYNSLTRDDLLAHYTQQYQSGNCTIIIAGKIDKLLTDLLAEHFEKGWPAAGHKPDAEQQKITPAAEKFYYTEKPQALQSAIRIGMPFINRTNPDFPAMQVLNTILGGYFGSRLMANIREDKGYTYGIGSGVSSFRQGGSFFIASEVGADVCKAAVIEIEKEVNLLKTDLVPDDELSLVRNFMLGSLLGSLENVFSHADKFKNLLFSGLGYDYYDYYTETVKNITAEQLKDLANKYWDFSEFYKVIVGKY